ncbi:Sorting nexin, cytoplasm-to-vacuole targeting pathway/endosomal sorting [Allomyces javanicus]|nr:Sorting nexin, cytoplasm-to-vacuole targeting pathway/endosomal sorting [Allomyces javanicus]
MEAIAIPELAPRHHAIADHASTGPHAAHAPTTNQTAPAPAATSDYAAPEARPDSSLSQGPSDPDLSTASASWAADGPTSPDLGHPTFQTDSNVMHAPDPRSMEATVTPPCCSVATTLDALRRDLIAAGEPYSDRLVRILDAQKVTDGAGFAFTAYLIRYGDTEIRRRYSDFYSLRKCLLRMYPALLIPPIPEKHSFANYATQPASAKDDPVIIARRQRRLQGFLNRLAWHPTLGADHLVHGFLSATVSWTDTLRSAKVTTMPSSPPKSSKSPHGPSTSAPTAALTRPRTPVPLGNAHQLQPDPRFVDVQVFTDKFAHQIASVARHHGRLVRRYVELHREYAELASVYCTLSLEDDAAPAVAAAMERIGLALDTMTATTLQLSHQLDEKVGESLFEYGQYAHDIKTILKYHHEQYSALSHAAAALQTKRAQLEQLERADEAANRIAAALSTPDDSAPLSPSPTRAISPTRDGAVPLPSAVDQPPPPSPAPPPRGLLGTLSALLAALLGQRDSPTTARVHQLAQARELLAQLEDQTGARAHEAQHASHTILLELDWFQRQKVRDLKTLLVQMATTHAQYARKNLAVWKHAKDEICKIPLPDQDDENQDRKKKQNQNRDEP